MAASKKYQAPEMHEKNSRRLWGALVLKWANTGGIIIVLAHGLSSTVRGELYRFDHTVENAKRAGVNIYYGSDAFAQIVLALEDLARIVNRGIYDLKNWVAGMKALPEHASVPGFCGTLGLDHFPVSENEINKAFRRMAKLAAPDAGGDKEEFIALNEAKESALAAVRSGSNNVV